MENEKVLAEPYKIKSIEKVRKTTKEEREKAIKEAGYNTFLLRSEDVYIDLLTDSGTNAMSDKQWAAMMLGDEAYAGSKNFENLKNAITEHYGYKNLIPVHQGRGAEHILSLIMIKGGFHYLLQLLKEKTKYDEKKFEEILPKLKELLAKLMPEEASYIPQNMYFTTTRLHQELAGGIFVDMIIKEAHEPESDHPFKGNFDLEKLEAFIKKVGPENIPYVNSGATVNMAGGQPQSMENMKKLRELTKKYNLPLMLDATRTVENCYFIKKNEKGYEDKSIKEILKEFCSYTDGCTMSAKKDLFANIGGFLALNDDVLAEKARNLVVVFEGLHTYGGMAGRDMEALAQGIKEAVENDMIEFRVEQVHYLWKKLIDAGIPLVHPAGGHAVFIDARKFLPHIPQKELPAQSLAAEIYVESGVRTMERGVVSAGRSPKTGDHNYPALELVRITIPRRVYTNSHMDIVAQGIINLYKKRNKIKGLKIVYEPKHLRFFQARFEKL